MIEWFLENLPTVVVVLVILIAVIGTVYSLRKKKKAGKNSCGCGCSGCPWKDSCHENGGGEHDTE